MSGLWRISAKLSEDITEMLAPVSMRAFMDFPLKRRLMYGRLVTVPLSNIRTS